MRRRSTRIIALLLMLAVLISCFAGLVYASEPSVDGEDVAGDTENDNVGGDDDAAEDEVVHTGDVIYNRDYSDGWGVYNGVGDNPADIMKDHNFYIDYELTADYSYNYFARFEIHDDPETESKDGFIQLEFKTAPKKQRVYVEFDIMADDYIGELGGIGYFRAEGASANGVNVPIMGVYENRIYPFNSKSEQSLPLVDEWVHVVVEFDYTDAELLKENSQWYVNIEMSVGSDTVKTSRLVTALTPGYTGLDIVRIGPTTSAEQLNGMSFCLDNLQAYENATGRLTEEQIDEQGYGSAVDVSQIKTETILGQTGDATTKDYLDDSLAMKVGVNYALVRNKKINIYDGSYGAPVLYDDAIVVPLEEILEYVGYPYYVHEDGSSYDISTGTSASYLTMGRTVATVDGSIINLSMAPGYYTDPNTEKQYPIIALDDVETLFPGYYVTYDDMGLIIICKKDDIINRVEHLATMIEMMKDFVYNFVDADTLYKNTANTTENFTHPYLLGDQEKFDKLIAIWDGTDTKVYDVDLKKGLTSQVNRAYALYECFALPSESTLISSEPVLDDEGNPVIDDETGEPAVKNTYSYKYDEWIGLDWTKSDTQRLIQPYADMGGYDVGGRLGDAGTAMNWAHDIAFGYIMTGDIKLAQCAYALMVEVGEWDHWGPGHFLNVSEASLPYALALDWIYNGIVALENGEIAKNIKDTTKYSVGYLEDLLYKNGVHMGYLATTGQPCPWPRPPRCGNDVYFYSTMENNWNAVCTGGMWMASLALMGNEKYRDEASWLCAKNIETIALYGLDQYPPDGSYVESPGYWGYGSNYLFHGLMALMTATGDDYGILDAAGIDKTCYFACFAESSDYEMFNYHDSSEGQSVDSVSFMFMSTALNDPVLAEIRKIHLNSGKKGMSIRDFLFYPFEWEDSGVEVELPLDYYMEGIDGFTTRSSWDSGALFAGIIGGDNSASHGQIDSGTFVYHNMGVKWITDLGADEYNVYHYFTTPDRYRYYRMNAEGNNTLALVSAPEDVPYGQKTTGYGEVISQGSNEFGSYVTIENTDVYGGYTSYARRGMLLTNNRETLVIQDEVSLVGFGTMKWFAHFNSNQVDYEISPDGTSMYLFIREGYVRTKQVRLSIVSDRKDYRFEVTSCYDFTLGGDKGTVDKNWTLQQGGVAEKSRDAYSRIVITSNALVMNMAVVIEAVDPGAPEEPEVGYTWVDMADWEPSGDASVDTEEPEDGEQLRGTPKTSEIVMNVKRLNDWKEENKIYVFNIRDYFFALSSLEYAVNYFRNEPVFDSVANEYQQFLEFKSEYDGIVSSVMTVANLKASVVSKLCGIS